jgi:hypothetical protein
MVWTVSDIFGLVMLGVVVLFVVMFITVDKYRDWKRERKYQERLREFNKHD